MDARSAEKTRGHLRFTAPGAEPNRPGTRLQKQHLLGTVSHVVKKVWEMREKSKKKITAAYLFSF
jgi:hypothetical protein